MTCAFLGVLAVLTGLDGQPPTALFVGLLPMAAALSPARLAQRMPLVEVGEQEIHHRSAAEWRFRVVDLARVIAIEWPGFDNVGVRLADGSVTSISVLELDPLDRSRALAAIRAACAHAIEQRSWTRDVP